jgi:hypothetical protein
MPDIMHLDNVDLCGVRGIPELARRYDKYFEGKKNVIVKTKGAAATNH